MKSLLLQPVTTIMGITRLASLLLATALLTADIHSDVGRLLCVGFYGTEVSPVFAQELQAGHVGGVVLFNHNIESPTQLKNLCSHLRELSPHPLLIAIDQEGGLICRLDPRKGFAPCPPAPLQQTAQETFTWACCTAKQLQEMGINVNLAPVVDLHDAENPCIGKKGRSFAAEPANVIEHAKRFIDAHRQRGILTVLKHYPGLGKATTDTHAGFADLTASLSDADVQPFYELIEEGYADAIMAAHITHRDWDAHWPISLSPALQQHLRPYFNGLIFSDDLLMGAIHDKTDLRTAIIRSINAGCDVAVIASDQTRMMNCSYDEALTGRAVEWIQEAIASGVISQRSVEVSLQRLDQRLRPLEAPQ